MGALGIKVNAATLSLFTSCSTLICCALPALLVTLGLGAALVSFLEVFPQLIWLSEHKSMTFIFSGCMLLIAGVAQCVSRNKPCPIDPELAQACKRGRKVSKWIYGISLSIYLIGFFFAYVAVYIF